jgi:hypothetical protein
MMRLTLAVLLGFFVAVPAFAQDGETAAEETIGEIEAFDREPVRCIIPSRIDRTEVNRLTNACRSLAREKRFSYDVRTNRLCSVDSITVLEWWGTGLSRGMSCGLGEFYPITEEEAELLDADPAEMREAQDAIEETSGSAEADED